MWQRFKDFLYNAFLKLYQAIESAVLTIFDALKDFFFWGVDTLLGFVMGLLSAFSMPLEFNPASLIADLPPEVLNMMGLLGLNDCLLIISAAILIRLGLQLIPFVRLGS